MKADLLVVVSDEEDVPPCTGRIVTADDFLAGGDGATRSGVTVVNLCRSWRYLSKGYYVSLLADARGQKVLPTVDTIEGIQDPHGVFRALEEAGIDTVDVEEMTDRRRFPATITPADEPGVPRDRKRSVPLVREESRGVVTYRPAEDAELAHVLVFLGQCQDKRFRRLAAQVYRVWPIPILQVSVLREEDVWKVVQVTPVKVHKLPPSQRDELARALEGRKRLVPKEQPADDKVASVAVLYDERDRHKPSTAETIDRLAKVAAKQGVYVTRIGPGDLGSLGDYDALFIRTLTGLDLPAFQFALRAEALGMPVIDDTRSIIRCSNKVYLQELLQREEVPTPRTVIATRHTDYADLERDLRLPFVLKLPDGSFSTSVFKVTSGEEYGRRSGELFQKSPLLIAQAYTPTAFDWRVTTLDGKPLFACRYFMAHGHWQIANNTARGTHFGRVEAVPVDDAPRDVVRLACRVSKLIGEGLYGVDLKDLESGPVVIEVNDNPNIDVGYDDAAEGDYVYRELVAFFLRKLQEERQPKRAASAARSGARRRPEDPSALALRRPIGRRPRETGRPYGAYEVCGIELEYAVVDRDLNAASLVEPLFGVLAGHPASDVSLGVVGFSNEIADHVLEVKTEVPLKSLVQTEALLVEGLRRASAVLADRFGARLLPTAMHPWLDPRRASLWSRSCSRIYQTYARLFDVSTHGWLNVQSCHVNLPLGQDHEAVAMMNAAALLVPYLPALAASSPMHDGELQPASCNRLEFILTHQQKVPESCGQLVPEFCRSLGQYKRDVLGPIYRAVDRLPDAKVLRHEFMNARGAVFKFSRDSMEVRVLDAQECVKMDVALAAFVRAALEGLAQRLLDGKVELPDHALLVEDFRATVRDGTRARVFAPYLGLLADGEGKVDVRTALRELLALAAKHVSQSEAPYLDLVAGIVEHGNLSERIRAALLPYVDDDDGFTEAARRLFIGLSECLTENTPWAGRRPSATPTLRPSGRLARVDAAGA